MKKVLIFLFTALISLCLLTSCGSFFSDEELMITSITSKVLEDGSTKLIITYNDETKKPDEFIIPRGLTGNGIKEIKATKGENNGSTTIEIIYTDDNMQPITFEVKDGNSIQDVEVRKDEETGEEYLVFLLSDGTECEPILLPKGEKGEDGRGIEKLVPIINDDNSVTIKITFTDGTEDEITMPALNGIESVEYVEDSTRKDKYILRIKFTSSDETQDIELPRPKEPSKWLSGNRAPEENDGDDGDYFMDPVHKIIWAKENGYWYQVINFGESYGSCTITFKLNDEDDIENPASIDAPVMYINIERNSYFWQSGNEIPIPYRNGYKFVGWYRSKNPNKATAAPFTDFTVILSDLTLYAMWEKA